MLYASWAFLWMKIKPVSVSSSKFFRIGSRIVCIAAPKFFRMGSRPMLIPHTGSTLKKHISSIIGRCPKKQMVRIYTTGNVALMTNRHALRNSSSVYKPRSSMSAKIPSFCLYLPIPIGSCGKQPKPTPTVRLRNTAVLKLSGGKHHLAATFLSPGFRRNHISLRIAQA